MPLSTNELKAILDSYDEGVRLQFLYYVKDADAALDAPQVVQKTDGIFYKKVSDTGDTLYLSRKQFSSPTGADIF